MTENKKTIGKDNQGMKMTRVRVESFSISLDGYGAGPDQSVDNPLGVGGEDLHDWIISTRSWRQMHGKEGGAGGIDDDFAVRGTKNVGAWILGRNMFGPIRGPWPDMNWKGWWGDNPPYHVPVYVLTASTCLCPAYAGRQAAGRRGLGRRLPFKNDVLIEIASFNIINN